MTQKNREFKFRAWTGLRMMFKELDDNNWYTGPGVKAKDIRSKSTTDCRKYKIMQYTGMKDKNDIEIYEGDVVRTLDIYGEYIGSIEWWNDRWTLKYKGSIDGTVQNQSLMTVGLAEVIGNIYENPELLVEKK